MREDYFVIDECLNIESAVELDDYIDDRFYRIGNYFVTKEESEKYAAKIRDLLAERRKI